MPKTKKVAKNNMILVLAGCVVVCAVIALSWMLIREVYLAESKSVQESKENIVINNIGASSDLVSALLAEKSGCSQMGEGKKNVDYIVREVDDFALVHYGCALDASMFYRKENGAWVSLSPTNNFINSIPLCSHVKQYSIPSSIQAYCYDGTPSAEGKLPPLISNPV